MGYACPVCDVPQRDAEHLANHLAFTAMLRHEEHEAWLNEHVPNWNKLGPAELADVVTDHAEETEYDEVFEDTVGSTHTSHDHHHGHGHGGEAGGFFDPNAAAQRGSASMSGEAQQVLQEAQELTRQMLEDGETEGTDPEAGDADDRESAGDSGTDSDSDSHSGSDSDET
ncbi:DUF5810 domain-containing protein [Haloprofundus salilacus]|uniref:DUF5810 domain-containing protein n=1 Tax=Haloprofundus salilacus TaxID=2876190 RepID=UPI001CCF69D8|nr:DUF5810 domain-containing protein [Haloprofundus salilacus]